MSTHYEIQRVHTTLTCAACVLRDMNRCIHFSAYMK